MCTKSTDHPPADEASTTLAVSTRPEPAPSEVCPADGMPQIPGYVLTRKLGQGAYGGVFQAVKVGAGQDVAIKIFTFTGERDKRHLQREVDRLMRVTEHPHIVTLLDADFLNHPPFYAMALLRCGSLAELVRKGPFEDREQAAMWLEQIAKALVFAHGKGLFHCDLKPANVLLDAEANVRLVDFGQARVRGEATLSLGTLSYMAPEQAVFATDGEVPPDPAVSWDIYGAGATMYALLTSRPPHSRSELQLTIRQLKDARQRLEHYRHHVRSTPITPIRQINSHVDADLAAIVEHCLEPDSKRRYQHAGEILADLARRRENRPLRCHPRRAGYITGKFLKRNFGMVSIVIAALLALATLSTTAVLLGQAKFKGLESQRDELQFRLEQAERKIHQADSEIYELQSRLAETGGRSLESGARRQEAGGGQEQNN